MKWTLLAVLALSPIFFLWAQEFNAGFVQGLWYADEVVFADEPTRIYIAIRNNTGADLTGTVEFLVDGKRIERARVAALNNRIIESWADWTPSYGEHTITATLSRIELSQAGSSTKEVELIAASANDTIFVDYDTDRDGVGNEIDEDDDGDGLSDTKEKELGTDPLDPDSPPPPAQNEDGGNDESNNGENNDEETAAEADSDPSINRGNNEPAGLEQFLADNRADAALTSLTGVINNTKKRIDDYRALRQSGPSESTETSEQSDDVADEELRSSSATSNETGSATTSSSTETSIVNDSGFGEITRTETEPGPGIFAAIISLVGKLLDGVWTLLLFLLSVYLSHPALVQFTLLILILFLILKIARRLGRRTQ